MKKDKKIILINATSNAVSLAGPFPPLGLLSIGQHLKKTIPNVDVKILDGQFIFPEKLEEEIKRIKPDFVGIGFVFPNHDLALKLARSSKSFGAKVIFGGLYASGLAFETLKNRGVNSKDYCVDAVVIGDGEEAFGQYVRGISPKLIPNLVYYNGRKIIGNKMKSFPMSGILPALKAKLINPEDYFKEYEKRFPTSGLKGAFMIYSQKGCSWKNISKGGCMFCTIYNEACRLRDPRDIWKEVDELVYRYGVDYIWDASDNFLGNKSWFETFYKEFKKRSRRNSAPLFKVYAKSRDLCDEKTVKMLQELNAGRVFVGVESNDDKVLSNTRKGQTSLHNEKALSLLSKHKLSIRASFILGLPGESKESLAKTTEFARLVFEAGDDNAILPCIFTPLPNSLSFEFLKRKLKKRYEGKDFINWNDAINDWINHFCSVSRETVEEYRDYFRKNFPCNMDTLY